MDMGAFNLLNKFIKETNIQLKETYFTAFSSLIRGEFLAIKRLFIDKGGIELILVLLNSEKTTLRLKKKVVFLLRDLIYMDQLLHFERIERDILEDPTKKKEEKKEEIKKPQKKKSKKQKKIKMDGLYRKEKFNIVKYNDYKDIIKKKLWKGSYFKLTGPLLGIEPLKYQSVRENHLHNL